MSLEFMQGMNKGHTAHLALDSLLQTLCRILQMLLPRAPFLKAFFAKKSSFFKEKETLAPEFMQGMNKGHTSHLALDSLLQTRCRMLRREVFRLDR